MRTTITLAMGLIAACTCLLAGEKDLTLPAKVSTVVNTNVVHGDNTKGCSTCAGIRAYNWALYHRCDTKEPYAAPTEKWAVTNVVEITQLTVFWEREVLTYSVTNVLHSTTNRWKLEWMED